MRCNVCFEESGKSYAVREMMYGSRDEFEYWECSSCECLQLVSIPAAMEKYYPSNYHSFAPMAHRGALRRKLVKLRNHYAVSHHGVLGKILCGYFPPDLALLSLAYLHLERGARILDVGCGAGLLLKLLGDLGFRRLLGVDPFLPASAESEHGVVLKKGTIHEVAGEFDVIMFHHAFEHLPDPGPTLQRVRQLLRPGGRCVIRVPTAPSYAWQHYRTNWVQLDAPRHAYIHSRRSLQTLADRAGLQLIKVMYDSTAFQFWASEQYAADIALYDARSFVISPANSIFTGEQIATFERRAAQLNRDERGDQAVFYLQRSSSA